MTRRTNPRMLLVALSAIATALFSCQSTVSEQEPSGPVDLVSATFTLADEAWRPDSASWKLGSKSGAALLQPDSAIRNGYRIAVHLDNPLKSDTLLVTFWRNGMYIGEPRFTMQGGTLKALASNRDPVASRILTTLDSLANTFPADFPPEADSSLAKAFGVLLVEGDSLLEAGVSAAPQGLDTAAARRYALLYAVSTGRPLHRLVDEWDLGMDSARAADAIKALVPELLDSGDVEHLFPTPPVRIAQAISVAQDLHSDSLPVSVKGRFVGKNRLLGPFFRVLADGAPVANHFEFAQQVSPGMQSKTWDLDSAKTTLRAYGNAPAGAYTLVVWMEDLSGNADTSRIGFDVLPAPDRAGPSIVRVSPASDTIVSFDDSVATVEVRVADASGVASVELDGQKMTKSGLDTYRIRDTVPPTGIWTRLPVVARDSAGNETRLEVGILRQSKDAAKPKLSLLDPASPAGDTIPTTQATRKIRYRITDANPITLVLMGGIAATAENDSVWSANVPVAATGIAVPVVVQALNDKGNGAIDTVHVVRRKDDVQPSVAAKAGTRSVAFDSTSAKVVWKVSDNFKLDSVWLNGTPQTLRSDSLYTLALPNLALGNNIAAIRAKDAAGNEKIDTQIVIRATNTAPPILKLLAGAIDRQVFVYGTDSILVRWLVTGNEKIDSVAINGRRALNNKDTFFLKVAQSPGDVPVVAVARNLSGLVAKDSITLETKLKDKDGNLYRIRRMPDGRIWMAQNLRTNPPSGTASCAVGDCAKNGSLYTWSQAFSASDSADLAPQGICPSGWHVPTRGEWSALFKATMPKGATDSALALKSTSGWAGTIKCVGTICSAPPCNGTDLYDQFLLPNVSTTLGGVTAGRANYWLPGGAGTAKGYWMEIIATPSDWTTLKTSTFGVRCVQDSRIIKLPIDIVIKEPVLKPLDQELILIR